MRCKNYAHYAAATVITLIKSLNRASICSYLSSLYKQNAHF